MARATTAAARLIAGSGPWSGSRGGLLVDAHGALFALHGLARANGFGDFLVQVSRLRNRARHGAGTVDGRVARHFH